MLVLDFAVAGYIKIGGAVPQFAFCFCLVSALFEKDARYSAGVAAAAGAFADALSGHGFGTYMLTFGACALFVYAFRDKLFASKLLFLIPSVFVLSISAQYVYFLLHINDIKNAVIAILVSGAVYNCVLCAVMYPIVKHFFAERR